MWLERKTVLRLADHLVERLLHEGIEAGRGFVEDQQVWPVLERDDQPDFLLVALRVLAKFATRVDVEAGDQVALVGAVDATPQVGEVLERLAPGELVVERELAGQVADPPVDGHRVGGRLDAEDPCAPARRPDVVEQCTDRRRLAGAVRPEETEGLALVYDQVDVDDPAVATVGLGELFDFDDRRHG